MFDKLDFITEKYKELSEKVADPAVIADQKTWQKHMKEMAEIEPVVRAYESYRKMQSDLADARELIDLEDDEEMREMAKEEAKELEEKMAKAQDELKSLLLPKDPNDDKNVILEIRAGTGGEEAALFGNDLLRMYLRYILRRSPPKSAASSPPVPALISRMTFLSSLGSLGRSSILSSS